MTIWIIIITLIILFIILAIISFIKIDINTYNINNNKIDKNIKILLLSDLHNRNISNKLTNIINNESPDIIILSGDMVNEKISKTKYFFELYKTLEKYKVYYTFGNHEENMYPEDLKDYYKLLEKTNLNILNNKSVDLTNNIKLYGFNCDISYFEKLRKKKLSKEYIENNIGTLNKDKYNILIAHDPLQFDSYAKLDVNLILSGHVHGGVVKIPFIGGLLSPNYKFFPKYYEGKYIKNNKELIVSRGLGFCEKLPFRIFNPGEVVVINLMKN